MTIQAFKPRPLFFLALHFLTGKPRCFSGLLVLGLIVLGITLSSQVLSNPRTSATIPAAHSAKPVSKQAKAQEKKAKSPQSYLEQPAVQSFIDTLVTQDKLVRADVEAWLSEARYQPKVLALMDAPVAKPPLWHQYRPFFVNSERIQRGVDFWQAQSATLRKAEEEYGVPAAIIVAILGVETNYGRIKGGFLVLDALVTLAFDYPRRAEYFQEELRQFLLLAHEQQWNPVLAKGSYAGAMGIPQFMPTNIRKYGVDFDGDGQIDLWNNAQDVIGSVAHYLAEHGWQRGQPILMPVQTLGEWSLPQPENEPSKAVKPSTKSGFDNLLTPPKPWQSYQEQGVKLGRSASTVSFELFAETPVGILTLEEPSQPTYWLALPNFYVLTRYNRSRLYAAAVAQLAAAIEQHL